MKLVKRLKNSSWKIPVLLLLLTILAYGLLIPTLGFYFDDWPVIYMIQSGADFQEFYQYDRPFSAWTYVVTAPIFGTSSILWHTFTLLLRWLTSWLLWWVLKLIWPNHEREAAWIALLFSVHPVFLQQSIAVAYSQHFITYALFFLSCGTMLAALQKPTRAWLLFAISTISAILHIFTMEYFWGLELVRPLLLWLFLTNQGTPKENKNKQTIFRWLPYMAIIIIAVIWRVVFYSQNFTDGNDPNSLRLLTLVKTTPLKGVAHFSEMVIRDFIFLMLSTWSRTIQPGLIKIDASVLGFSWVLVVLSIIILWIYRTRLAPSPGNDSSQVDSIWIRQACVLGIVIFITGTLPVWMTDKSISIGMYSDRFALPGMWGASVLLLGVISLVGVSRRYQSVILSIMIGLAVGAHFRVANDYRWDWTNQQRFFWQLYWRAPELEPQTSIFSDGTIFTYLGDYPTAFAINAFYGPDNDSTELSYWFIELDSGFHNDPVSYLDGFAFNKSLRNFSFKGNSLKSIVLYYDPKGGNCLWILDDSDVANKEIPSLTWDALPLSDLNRIETNSQLENQSFQAIFGKEPDLQWCKYFQKAESARQEGLWNEIINISTTVDELGLSPNNKLEWLPFIEAYAQVGKWREAGELTLSAYESAPLKRNTFCSVWGSFNESNMGAGIDQSSLNDIFASLSCQ